MEHPSIAPVVQLVSSTTLMPPSIRVNSCVGPDAYIKSAHLYKCLSSGREYRVLSIFALLLSL
jgi:hypothetical protein